jgi:hypothetical protein
MMGASSVTGIGDGSVERHGGGKGPGNLRNNFIPLQGPNIVACGFASMVPDIFGEYRIRTPCLLIMPEDHYAAFVMPINTSQPNMGVSGVFSDGNGYGSIIVVNSIVAGQVYWMIVRQGFGIEALNL